MSICFEMIGKRHWTRHSTLFLRGLSLLFMVQTSLAQEALLSRNWGNGLRRTVVEFDVVDENENPVSEADASVVFIKSDSLAHVKSDHGRTDENGHLKMGGFSTGEVIFHFSKEGYYRTSGRVWFQRQGQVADEVCWEQDKRYGQNFWPEKDQNALCRKMPCRVIMKKVQNPHPMCAFDVDSAWPDDLERIGFDFEECDWVAPRGKGTRADIWFVKGHGEPDDSGAGHEDLKLDFGEPESGNGYICLERDYWSERGWLLDAPENGYEEKLVISPEGPFAKALAMGEKYLIVRIRVKRDEKGDIVSARYGVIRLVGHVPGRGGVTSASVHFDGWMNLQENERGLESTYTKYTTVR